jgi:hypothetical protein
MTGTERPVVPNQRDGQHGEDDAPAPRVGARFEATLVIGRDAQRSGPDVAGRAPDKNEPRERREQLGGGVGQRPVLFLDIDGVLNTRFDAGWPRWTERPARLVRPDRIGRPTRNRPARAISRAKITLLNDLCASSGCAIVVSSTWRLDRDVPAILASIGFARSFVADWRTDADGPTRGDEVWRWLDRHGNPRWAAVDDKPDFHPHQLYRVVLTDPYDGLKPEHCDRLAALLSEGAR